MDVSLLLLYLIDLFFSDCFDFAYHAGSGGGSAYEYTYSRSNTVRRINVSMYRCIDIYRFVLLYLIVHPTFFDICIQGGSGGGRIYIKTNATLTIDGRVSSNGGDGGSYNGWGGGGGSGGSILIEAVTLAGRGSIEAKGGKPTASAAGGGSGGHVALHHEQNVTNTAFVSVPVLSVSVYAYGGWSSSASSTCGGAASGTVFERHGVWSVLRLDNNDSPAADNSKTPLPLDLAGIVDDSMSSWTWYGPVVWAVISHRTHVELRDAVGSGTAFHAWYLDLSTDSTIYGAIADIHFHEASLHGDVTTTSSMTLSSDALGWPSSSSQNRNNASLSSLQIHETCQLSCSSCPVTVETNGTAAVEGDISALTMVMHVGKQVILGSTSSEITLSGTLVSIRSETDSVLLDGDLSCTGSSCTVSLYAPALVDVTGSLSCSELSCILLSTSGNATHISGDITASGTWGKVTLVSQYTDITGLVTASSISIETNADMTVSSDAVIHTDERGHSENSGTGAGGRTTSYVSCCSSTDSSGAGGGHGGDGGTSCGKGSRISSYPIGGSAYGSTTYPTTYGKIAM